MSRIVMFVLLFALMPPSMLRAQQLRPISDRATHLHLTLTKPTSDGAPLLTGARLTGMSGDTRWVGEFALGSAPTSTCLLIEGGACRTEREPVIFAFGGIHPYLLSVGSVDQYAVLGGGVMAVRDGVFTSNPQWSSYFLLGARVGAAVPIAGRTAGTLELGYLALPSFSYWSGVGLAAAGLRIRL